MVLPVLAYIGYEAVIATVAIIASNNKPTIPDVYYSSNDKCIEVKSDNTDHTCSNLPKKYNKHVLIEDN